MAHGIAPGPSVSVSGHHLLTGITRGQWQDGPCQRTARLCVWVCVCGHGDGHSGCSLDVSAHLGLLLGCVSVCVCARACLPVSNSLLPWWLRQWRICLQCRRPGFDPWVRKIPWRREWQPTPGFSPGESHGQRSLVGYSPRGHKELGTTEPLTPWIRGPTKPQSLSWLQAYSLSSLMLSATPSVSKIPFLQGSWLLSGNLSPILLPPWFSRKTSHEPPFLKDWSGNATDPGGRQTRIWILALPLNKLCDLRASISLSISMLMLIP